MKLKIEIDPDQPEELILRAPALTDQVRRIRQALETALSRPAEIALRRGDEEVYLPYAALLFFEVSDERVWAHDAADRYACSLRLHELAAILPRGFTRASKSCLINTARVRSISRSPTGVSLATFADSDKTVYISRMYYKTVRDVIEETRLGK
ncbi:MAG: LytTR family DNA-binding domain-containing protein [Acutalibacteraceae bacterium]|jgi:DNA-binding LytR/AlgR family response regulator